MNIITEILEIIFPTTCIICGGLNKNALCKKCETKLESKLVYKMEKYKNKNFETHIYIANYKGQIRNKILNYKFHSKPYMYKTFAKITIKSQKIYEILKTYDIITEIPIHKKRKNKRGYDQSQLIAREIGSNVEGLEYKQILQKTKNIVPQSSLNKKQRKQNIKDAYKIQTKEKLLGKRIILFDDIYTTGSTANECAKELKQAGVKEVLILSLAK